jgi:hypothetical protein
MLKDMRENSIFKITGPYSVCFENDLICVYDHAYNVIDNHTDPELREVFKVNQDSVLTRNEMNV